MGKDKIVIKGAKEHNLKNIDLKIPRNKLVVITGLSGSGKSSLAFDTLYAEGQRRYVESLSAYARQFLEQLKKPNVESIDGLSPAIAIEQRKAGANPRSTVGTMTEIYDYLRLLFARIGLPHCPKCGREISPQTSQEITDRILALPEETRIQVLAPLVRGRKGEYKKLFEDIQREGYVRVRVNGKVYDLAEVPSLDRYKKHDIEVMVDRLIIKKGIKSRLADSVETALRLGKGIVLITVNGKRLTVNRELLFSEHFACIKCGISFGELSPRMFSFNSPHGACSGCDGLGIRMEVDPDLVVPDRNFSIYEGAILPWSEPITTRRHKWKYAAQRYYSQQLETVAEHYDFNLHIPWKNLKREERDILLYGSGDDSLNFHLERHGMTHKFCRPFEGIINQLERRYRETSSEYVREEIKNKYMRTSSCPDCKGARLKPESLAVTVGEKSIAKVCALSIKKAQEFFSNLKLSRKEALIGREVIKEIRERLNFLINVGLDYLTIDRMAGTLSGGEGERTRLATQIGSGLVGVLYILDEPSIGLHQRDNRRLLNTLKALRDLGNTVLVVEHDAATIRFADHIIDLGPGAGRHGGEVVVSGPLEKILRCKRSLTGRYLKGELKIEIPKKRRPVKGKYLTIIGAREHNLKNIKVPIPLGVFTCITGVSGSGKSTLVDETLYRALANKFYKSKEKAGEYDRIEGLENIDKVIIITQDPIGRTPRSNSATYTGVFTPIRELFSQIPESKIRGYRPGRFSFNVKGGRCEACQGDGIIKIEMHFLPDVYVSCEVCKGKRFNRETLEIRYKGRSIAEVLDMIVEEALKFFKNIPKIKHKLQTLYDVGLGYIKLGQSATTLSGGEAQRVKLATELSKRSTGKTFYILDEPTTGLHFADIQKLLDVLNRLVDMGNTVLVIEHHPDVIKTADYIIDLGPEGGEEGGFIVTSGTPEKVARRKESYTGQLLKKILA
ncbi:MAG TPA: excinuclease ABC subunit UvrA [bacterium]|nr:excinuclease ABC subunit UvrA [bacterium]